MCIPYKSKEGIANLEDIKDKCLYGQFNTCISSRVWSYFLRKKVVNYKIGSPDVISDSKNENLSKQLMWKHYKTRPKPNLEALERLDKENDSEYTDKISNSLWEIVFETHIGTLVRYIDEVEEAVKNDARHRVLLRYLYPASKDFQKNRWPGNFEQNLDFSENGLLKNAKQVLSEYFNSIQYSLIFLYVHGLMLLCGIFLRVIANDFLNSLGIVICHLNCQI